MHTNETTNYQLSQFIETDKPGWLTDYNEDMRKIDSNMKAISDVANGASGSISSLDDRMTAAEGAITTNANDIDALEARADALEAGQTADDSRLDALEAEQIVQNTAIESNTRLGYNVARPYDAASTYPVGAYAIFQDTLYKCDVPVTTGEAFDPTKWISVKATDDVQVIIYDATSTTSDAFDSLNTTDFTHYYPKVFRMGELVNVRELTLTVSNANGLSAGTWYTIGILKSEVKSITSVAFPVAAGTGNLRNAEYSGIGVINANGTLEVAFGTNVATGAKIALNVTYIRG